MKKPVVIIYTIFNEQINKNLGIGNRTHNCINTFHNIDVHISNIRNK